MKFLSKLISTFFGIGYFPVAPGTLTSLIIVLLYRFYLYKLSWFHHLLLFFFLFFIGVFASSKFSSVLTKKDPRNIVIDEVAGQYLVLFQMSNSWFAVLSCLVLFRLFDIVKPFPTRQVEKMPGGWGIMLDDIVAAIYAGVIINLYMLMK